MLLMTQPFTGVATASWATIRYGRGFLALAVALDRRWEIIAGVRRARRPRDPFRDSGPTLSPSA
jgi:hypothetical protein